MPTDGMRILLADPRLDDTLPVRQQLLEVLRPHQVTGVNSTAELESQAGRRQFDAILINLTSGYEEVATWIAQARRGWAQTPILALVSGREPAAAKAAMQAGATSHLPIAPGWTADLTDWLSQREPPSSSSGPGNRSVEDLFEEHPRLQKSIRQWTALSEVSRTLSSTLEPDKVLKLVLEQAVQVLGAIGGSLVLVDRQTSELVFELATGPIAAHLVGTRMPWGVGLVGEAATTGQPVLVNDAAADPRWFSGYDEATDFVTQSILCAPMIARQQVIGVLEIVNKRDGSAFTEDEAELLLALASQAATAISNARLYAETRRQAEEVAALLETSHAVTSTLDLSRRLRTISHKAQELVDADGCVILLLDKENQLLKPIIALGDFAEEVMRVTLKLGEGISGKVALTGKERIANQAHLDPDAAWIPDTPLDPECLLAVPLQVKGTTIGVMSLSRQGERGFTAHDLELISSLGNHVAVAIENARLYNAAQQRNKELTALYSIAMALGQTLEMHPLLDEALKQVLGVLGHTGGAIFLASGDDEELRLVHHREIPDRVLRFVSSQPQSTSAIDKAAATRHIVDEPMPLPSAGPPLRLICAPLLTGQRVLGVLVISAFSSAPMRLQDKRLLETLCRQVGVAVENAALYAQLQERAETLQRAYDELAEIDRLKDELVQNISHELRTPITFIKGYVSLLLDDELGELTAEQSDSLKVVANKTEQLIRLVNDILTLQTLTSETLKVEPVSLGTLATRAIAGASLSAKKAGIEIVVDCPSDLPTVMADPARITQVFDNLLENAIKFSPERGVIRVGLRAAQEVVRVEISDQGIGISADRIDQIFDRFYQIDGSATRRFGGVGLGLAICKQIISAHKGEIEVQSEEGVGSTFLFSIPLATADIPTRRPPYVR